MNSKQTISTDPITSRIGRFETNRTATDLSSDAVVMRTASMLLGVRLREGLTNREQEFLDSIAADNSLVFLVRGDKYLHPQDAELFPPDLIETTISMGADAVFSHRYEANCADGPHPCRVYTGLVGIPDHSPLVLGMFGPDDPFEKQAAGDQFAYVIGAFREAERSVALICDALPDLSDSAARMLVDRASGRVIHADRALLERMDIDSHEVIGREYSAVAETISPLLAVNKLRMENFAGGCLNIACFTFTPNKKITPVKTTPMAEDIVDFTRDRVAAVTTSAGFIEDNAADLTPDDVQHLAGDIVRAGERLDRRLARHQLLADFDNMERTELNILYQLEQAIDHISALGGDGITLKVDSNAGSLTDIMPYDAYLLLFESILETHRFARGVVGDTEARLGRDADDNRMSITFTTILPASLCLTDLERVWYQDTEAVARKMGVSVSKNLILESNTIVTRLTIRPQEETVA